jgi:chromosome partitioning protein
MITVAVYNIKGGVGKTATAVNLAYLSAEHGNRTLLCDLDPQGSASYYFRIKAKLKSGKKSLIRGGKNIEKNIKATDFDYLDLLPSDFSLRNLDISLDHSKSSKTQLRSTLKAFKKEYDYIYLDCPPNITLVSENIFLAADFIIVPVIPTTLSYRSYKKLKDFFNRKKLAQEKLIPFFSMVEKRKSMHLENIAQIRRTFPGVLDAQIPYSSVIERMGIYREPVVAYKPNSQAGIAYASLYNELTRIMSHKV